MCEKKTREFGYIRVSSKDQNEARQLAALREQGIPEKRLFMDKKSGKDFQRPGYRRLLRQLRPGDTLFVLSIDRLGRNYEEIREQWRLLTQVRKVDMVVLDMPLLDTRHEKNLMGSFIADLVLEILSFVAESERENIRERQRQGIREAKKRGVRFGRREIPLPENFEEIVMGYRAGALTLQQALDASGMSRATFYRRLSAQRQLKVVSPVSQSRLSETVINRIVL